MDKNLSEALGLESSKGDILYYNWDHRYVNFLDDADVVIIKTPAYREILNVVLHLAGVLRIQRERANADRDLRPKKQRCGYVLKSWQKVLIRNSYFTIIKLQTPWNISDYRDVDTVEDLVKKDSLDKLLGYTGEDYNFKFSPYYNGGKYWNVEIKMAGYKYVVPREILPYEDGQTDS